MDIPCLYQVDATICIQQFAIIIGDKNVENTSQDTAKVAKLRFSKEHTLIIYPYIVLKSLGEKIETKLDNATLFISELDSNLHNDNKVSLYNADEIHRLVKI